MVRLRFKVPSVGAKCFTCITYLEKLERETASTRQLSNQSRAKSLSLLVLNKKQQRGKKFAENFPPGRYLSPFAIAKKFCKS
jgi:hypothetical protein